MVIAVVIIGVLVAVILVTGYLYFSKRTDFIQLRDAHEKLYGQAVHFEQTAKRLESEGTVQGVRQVRAAFVNQVLNIPANQRAYWYSYVWPALDAAVVAAKEITTIEKVERDGSTSPVTGSSPSTSVGGGTRIIDTGNPTGV